MKSSTTNFLCLYSLLFVIALSLGLSQVALAQTPSYPALQALEGNDDPSVAYGLDGTVDWSPQMPFIDIMKSSRGWIGHVTPGRWGGMSYDQVKASGVLDENGWPRRLPDGTYQIGTVWAWGNPQYGAEAARAGNYILTYKGEGTMTVSGRLTNVVQTPGKITFTSPGNIDLSLNITATDPNQTGNYIRDISIVKDDYADLYAAGAIFNPEWIELVKDARQLRFMDWTHTNGSPERIWSERARPETFTWTISVPVEVMVHLANEIGMDPWFSLPFHADDNYVREFAIYVRNNLNPELVASVELSNEVWNFIFSQTRDARTLSERDFGGVNGAGFANYYGKRASQVMRIFTDVYGAETATRLQRVAGAFTANSWLTAQILEAPLWRTADPAGYVAPHTYFDAIGLTSYFGSPVVANKAHRDSMLQFLSTNSVDDYSHITSILRGEVRGLEGGSIPEVTKSLAAQKIAADRYNLDMVLYEGGQHVHHSAFVDVPKEELDRLQIHLAGFVRSEEMVDLYEELWDVWQAVGDGPFMQFTDIGRPTVYGSWGIRASLSDSNPRATFLDEQNELVDAWFEDRGGDHFQQGKTVVGTDAANTLAGTVAVDYILAKEGNDTIYPGLGNDGISGGEGTDTVLLRGNSSASRVALLGSRYIVTGPDGKDTMSGVERLQFEDGTTRTLSVDTVDPVLPPTVTSRFAANSRVVTSDTPTVRSSYGTGAASLGAQTLGSLGTVGTQPAQSANGYTWIYVNFDGGVDGWVADAFLNAVVAPTPTPTPTPTVTISAEPTSVTSGNPTALTWSSTNATACTAAGGWTGSKAISGTQSVSPTATATYTLSCTGAGGTKAENTTVNVVAVPTNQAPVATDDAISVDANATITGFNVLTNDTDANSDSLSVKAATSVPGSGGGKFALTTAGLLSFLPNGNFDRLTVAETKTTSFTYTLSDGKATDTGVITVTVRGAKAVAPTPSSDDVSVTQRGLRLDGGSETNTATVALGSKGIMVKAINIWSKLGTELNLSSDKVPAYVVAETGASAVVNGKTLPESYWTLFEDVESKSGSALTGSAITTSLLFGSIITNFEKVVGTDTNDQMYGRDANDYFVTKKGSDYVDGGAGSDTIRLLGNSTDYVMVQKDSRYQLTSSQSSVNLAAVEYLEFDDGKFSTEDTLNRLKSGAVLGESVSIPNVYGTQLQSMMSLLQALKQQLGSY